MFDVRGTAAVTVPPPIPSSLRLRPALGAERARLEAFIADRFAEVYQARITRFMPELLGLYDGETLVAAFGLREAAASRLFLETYLDEPIENAVARLAGSPVDRAGVIEVGNLAGATHGALRELIPCLCAVLHARGARWAAFTGAPQLCKAFTRTGLPLLTLCPARLQRLPEHERADWGCYYERSPAVMVGDVATAQRYLLASPEALDRTLAPVAKVGAP